MAKIKYRIQFAGSGGAGDTPVAGIVSAYLAGASGTPQSRVYPIADTPPAFANYPIVKGGVDGPVIPDGEYYVDYKDDESASTRLAKIKLTAFADSCYNDGVFVNPYYQLLRFENYFEINAHTSAGAAIQASIDGGLTWKNLLYSGGSITAFTSWTNAEIAAMGHTDNIPTVKIRRTKLTNKRNVFSFSEPFDDDFPAAFFTRANMPDTSGFVLGNVINFYNSSMYFTGQIVELNAGSIVFQTSFYGSHDGAFAAIPVNCEATITEEVFIGEPSFPVFIASETHTNETAAPADDGTINLNVTGGSGDFSFAWNDGSTAQNRTNLQAGTYEVTITDNITGQEEELTITITEPAPEVIPNGTYADVPKIQTLRFVREAVIDNCNTFQNFDNTLFCKMEFHGIAIRTPFCQKVCKCDPVPIQIHSNFPSHQIELLRAYDGQPVKSFDAVLKQQLTGITQSFDGYLTDNNGTTDPAGSSRFFFNSATIPIPLQNGEVFSLINNADGFNGSYAIIGISNDPLLGAPYILISLEYDAPNPTSAARSVFVNNIVNFDVYETIFTFNDLSEGYYIPRIRFVNLDDSYTEFVGEPIDLKTRHIGTHLIEARNSDNALGVVYTTGITHRIRLESSFKDPLFTSEDENYRESNGDPVITSSKPQRRYRLDYYSQPFYRHELLGAILGFDFVTVNKVRYSRTEAPGDPKARPFYLLTNGSVILEQKGWFTDYNGDDLGDISPGFILTQHGYIQRT